MPGLGRRLGLAALIGLLVWLAAAPWVGATGRPAVAAPPRPAAISGQSLADFFDALIPAQLERRHVPGAAVVVVQDGAIALARGYGLADVEQRAPVAADRTLFHIGSNTKLFTWTAVMQLVEQGKLDLDADITTYLDFPIPATYPAPITLTHLMTHTAGFENRDIGMLASGPEAVTPLSQWLPAHLPARVRPPGVEAGYSNYGTALAGYIVERVSGLPYEAYVEQHLLGPLQMRRSTVHQAVPSELAPDVARGYVVDGSSFREQPLLTYQGFPTGSIRATATDIGHFMLAHLQDGRFDDGRILEAATARQMRQTLFRPDPRVNGLAHGFWEMDRNGQRVVGHLGSAAPLHYSLLALLPEAGVGLFVAYNGDTARPLTIDNETLGTFMDRFYPAPAAAPAAPASPEAARRAAEVAGEYRRNNYGGSYTTVEKVQRLLGQGNRRISHLGDGTLEVSTIGGSARFAEVAPDYYAEVGGQDNLLVRRDPAGRVTAAFFDGAPVYTYERLSAPEQPAVNVALLGACVVAFVSALLAAVVGWARGRSRRPGGPQGRLSRVARGLALGLAVVALLFLGGLVPVLADPAVLMGDLTRLRALLVLPLLGTLLAGGVVICAGLAWWRRLWSLAARVHYTIVALAGIAFTWFLAAWNLLGFRV
jgi:CubicO group peptidase (beta-lactamase class C family)